jgi:hypothetical protein
MFYICELQPGYARDQNQRLPFREWDTARK